MTVQHFSHENFQQQVLEPSHTKTVVVDFWAPWCGPCRALGPILQAVADAAGDAAVVGKVNIDDHPELASEFNISSIPSVLIFRDGSLVESIVGVRSSEDYLSALGVAGTT